MRLNLSKNFFDQARDSGDWFQYQLSVRYMPCVAFRPSECTSLMNISRPASFIDFVMPNSLAALTELMVSPPALARPRMSAVLACAWSRHDEKSLAESGWRTAPTTLPPAALTALVASVCSAVPKA